MVYLLEKSSMCLGAFSLFGLLVSKIFGTFCGRNSITAWKQHQVAMSLQLQSRWAYSCPVVMGLQLQSRWFFHIETQLSW